MNNWLTRFLGFHDKKQAEKSKEVVSYAQDKKEQYESDMDDIRELARKAHKQAQKSLKEAAKTVKITEDVTQRLQVVVDKRRIS